MLQNRIYRGEITHKGNSYPGEHPAIVEQDLWDQVQTVLAQNRIERATGTRAKQPSLLGGFVFDATGQRLSPTYAIKKRARYRYYMSSSLMREAGTNRSGGWRIPAGDLEGLVINRLRSFLVDPTAILMPSTLRRPEVHDGIDRARRQMAGELGAQPADKVKATLMALSCRVDVHADRIDISLSRQRLADLLAGQSIDLTMPNQKLDRASDDAVILTVPARLKRAGREMRIPRSMALTTKGQPI